MESKVLIGRRIKEYRRQSGLTQEELAEKVHLTPNYISAIERGYSFPRIEALIDIMNCIGASADQIFCDVVNKTYITRTSMLADKIESLSGEAQRQIFSVLEIMVENLQEKNINE